MSNEDYQQENETFSMPDVEQNLTAEQLSFEFPKKYTLQKLALSDKYDSYFDDCSFPPENIYVDENNLSCYDVDNDQMPDDVDSLVDDGRLSPFELPPPMNVNRITTKSDPAVGPATDDNKQTMPMQIRNSEEYFEEDGSSVNTATSTTMNQFPRVVLIQLSKRDPAYMKIVVQKPTCLTGTASDEGYIDDGDDLGEGAHELEAECTFYDVHREFYAVPGEQEAAVKIQDAWRGYCRRRKNKQTLSYSANEMNTADKKLQQLEIKLNEEIVMREILEKTMMQIVQTIDDQHVCFNKKQEEFDSYMAQAFDRIEQLESRLEKEEEVRIELETSVSRLEEELEVRIELETRVSRLEDELDEELGVRIELETRVSRLEEEAKARNKLEMRLSRLEEEAEARNELEMKLSCLSNQMVSLEASRLVQARKDAESKKKMQAILDLTVEEISNLKKKQASTTPRRLTTTKTALSNASTKTVLSNTSTKPELTNTVLSTASKKDNAINNRISIKSTTNNTRPSTRSTK